MSKFWKGWVYPSITKGSPWYISNYGRSRCLRELFSLFGFTLSIRILISGYQYWVYQDVFNRFSKLQWVDRDGNIDEEIKKDDIEGFKRKVDKQISAKLPHSPYCLNRTGKVVGSLDDLEWMFLLNCVSDHHESNVVYSWDKKGWIGFSHRGRQLFRVGDRIFEEDYVPKKKDYSNEQWMAFIEARNYSYTKYCEEHPGMEKQEYNRFHPLIDFIPFVLRGARTITNDPRARRAAINFSRYVA